MSELLNPQHHVDWAALTEGVPEFPGEAMPDPHDAFGIGPPDHDDEFERLVAFQLGRRQVRDEVERRYLAMTTPPVERPPLTSLADFLAIPDEPVSYLVDRLWPTGGRVVLSAQFKSGKSTMAMNAAAALVDGHRFLGEHAVPQTVRVAVLDNELDERAMRRWFRDIGIENPDRVSVVSLRGRVASFNILDDKIRAEWAKLLRGHDVLVFDCLRPVLDALHLSEDKEAGIFLVAFDALLNEAGIDQAMIVHHAGHGSERSRGDSRILDWPDATWTLVRDREASATASSGFFRASGRDVEIGERGLTFDPVSRRFVYSGEGSRTHARQWNALRAILAYLAEHAPTEERAMKSQNSVVAAVYEATEDITKTDLEKAAKLGRKRGLIQHKEGANKSFLHWVEDPTVIDRLIEDDGQALIDGAES